MLLWPTDVREVWEEVLSTDELATEADALRLELKSDVLSKLEVEVPTRTELDNDAKPAVVLCSAEEEFGIEELSALCVEAVLEPRDAVLGGTSSVELSGSEEDNDPVELEISSLNEIDFMEEH